MNLESAADANGGEDLANKVNDKDDMIDLFALANINMKSADEDAMRDIFLHPDTPNDVRFSMLVKFPLSTLLEFMKSKNVMDLISNAAFTEERSLQNVFLNMTNGYSLVDPHQDPPLQVMNRFYPFDAFREDEVELVGACHGLIFLEHGLVNNLKKYWVLNPIMRGFKRLSVPPPKSFYDICASGFGFDMGTKTLKYVRLSHDNCPCAPNCREKYLGILDVNTNIWTTIGHTNIPFEINRTMFMLTDRVGLYYKGSLYWLYHKRSVFSLNIETLVPNISEQLIPFEINVSDSGFGVVEKKLCLFVGVNREPKFMIWRLESEIWSLYSSFEVRSIGILESLKPLCLWNDGRLLFRQTPGYRFFLYDDKSCSRKYLDIDCRKVHYGRTRAVVFDESFVLDSSSGGQLVKKDTVGPKVPFHVLFAYCGNPCIQAAEAIFTQLVKDGNFSSQIEIDFALPPRNVSEVNSSYSLAWETDDKVMNPMIRVCDKRGLKIKTAPRLLKPSDLTKYHLILIISKDKKKSLLHELNEWWLHNTIPMKTIGRVKSFGDSFDNLNADTDFEKVLDLLEKRCKYMLDWILESNH